MKEKLLGYLVALALKVFTEERLHAVADRILDAIEEAVENSENTYDNIVLLPMCKIVREAFNVED